MKSLVGGDLGVTLKWGFETKNFIFHPAKCGRIPTVNSGSVVLKQGSPAIQFSVQTIREASS